MQCVVCKIEMELGHLAIHGYGWIAGKSIQLPNKGLLAWGRPKIDPVTAWQCPKCGKIELFSDTRSAKI